MTRFPGKVAIVTGAAAGIGARTARHLVDGGASVALLDRDARGLVTVAADLGGRTAAFTCDVADEASVRDAFAAVAARFGPIDIGILNAGIEGIVARIEDTDVDDFDRVMAVNARGVFLGLKHLVPGMRARRTGSIVVTASTAGLRGSRGLGAYVASKHAVIGLMKTAALECAGDGVRINAVCPAPVDTRMIHAIEAGFDPEQPGAISARIVAGVPLGRYASPGEIATLIGFLASDEASYLTGGAYLADGGTMAG